MKLMRGVLAIVAVVGVLLGCGGGEEKGSARVRPRIDPAHVKKISTVSVDDVCRSVGTVVPRTSSRIGSRVPGYVEKVTVREGDVVRTGQVLVVLRSDELRARVEGAEAVEKEARNALAEAQAALDEAQAQKALAERTYLRYCQLMERESVSQQEFDEALARYEESKARLRGAEEALNRTEARVEQAGSSLREARSYYEYTRIRAPGDGIVTEKAVNEGDLVAPGGILLVVEGRDLYRLECAVDESLTSRISVGDAVEVRLSWQKEKPLTGTVSEIVPRVDPLTRTFLVRVDLPSVEGIRSGMYGAAFFRRGAREVILVPKTALHECGQLSILFVVKAQEAVERRLVKTGKEREDGVEVLSGIEPGESIVTEGVDLLAAGCAKERRP